MSGRGRPLRFLALVLSGWIAMRAAMLWPRVGEEAAQVAERPGNLAPPALAPPHVAVRPAAQSVASPPVRWAKYRRPIVAAILRREPESSFQLVRAIPATHTIAAERAGGAEAPAATVLLPPVPPRAITERERWQASAWLAARPGAGGLSTQPQLGGSQAGLRLAWVADPDHRIAVVGRLAAPLRGVGREATLAVEWQPTRLPVRLVAEHRFALDRSTGGTGIGVVGGVDTLPVAAGFRLEAYGQAGVLHRARSEPYADGAARITVPVRRVQTTTVSVGMGAWGGAQRDAQRIDIGPTLVASMPLAGRNYRLAFDWRQRIVGSARPGSGPAVTLGGDF